MWLEVPWEKVYSLLSRMLDGVALQGKSNKGRVELWRNILVAIDQWGFTVDHQVIERQAEVSMSIPLAERLLSRFGEDAIENISIDKDLQAREQGVAEFIYTSREQTEESGKSFQKLRHKHSAVESDINSWSITAWIDVWIKGWKDLKGIVPWEY